MSYREKIKQHPLVRRMVEIVREASPGAQMILFGSRARGDHRQDSDWDILVLLDSLSAGERDRIWNPINDLELTADASINPVIRTKEYWRRSTFTPFHHNVNHDGIVLL